ncbi:protein XA-1 precursor [Xenopus laevis]|uniref:Protein XA-1 n=2 Tax=Xenopus laevis TaxID=8355 RepID=XA1_XENLA|nr:protein XA-1 precursor [Xenopus laevis]P23507.1 RecName: Full=Protein XA-1; Flags: Precursor [Xenopus laevis]AAI69484.1 Anterior and ectodermic-specific protein [Xenopus laevis]CAA37818.1 XA-1 product [Xenopus laevis]
MFFYVLLLALMAQGWSLPQGKTGEDSPVFRPPSPPMGPSLPPPVSHDLHRPSGHPEEFRTGASLPPKETPNEPRHGRPKRDLHHGKVVPTGVPHHTGEVLHHTDCSSNTHKSHEENRPKGFRTGRPLLPIKPEHGRHRRDLHHGKAVPTGVPHHTEKFHNGSNGKSHPPRPGHSTSAHNDNSSEEKRPKHGQEQGKKH